MISSGVILQLLAMLPAQFGGLLPLSFGLFHPSKVARNDTVELLTTLNGHRVSAAGIAWTFADILT